MKIPNVKLGQKVREKTKPKIAKEKELLEEKENHQKQCPHCKVSDETLEILKKAGKDKKYKQ